MDRKKNLIVQGTTKVIAIFGDPLTYTFSPKMQNYALSQLGLDMVYVPFVVKEENLGKAAEALRSLNMVGANITIPHKQKIIPYLDELTPLAIKVGAVNTVVRKGARLIGDNTDVKGFITSLKEDGAFDPKNKTVLLLGCGGVAKAISVALFDAEIKKLVILYRTMEHAVQLKAHLKKNYPQADIILENLSLGILHSYLDKCDLFINATPGVRELDALEIPPNVFVFDAVYAKVTPLILAAQRDQANHLDGLGMLIRQGALSFSLWTGCEPPVDLMRKALS